MPELYPGQTQKVESKITEAEALQQRDKLLAEAESDTQKKAERWGMIARRENSLRALRRQLAKCTGEPERREADIHMRFTPRELEELKEAAANAGLDVSKYIRSKVVSAEE